jgi:hypothetical protein
MASPKLPDEAVRILEAVREAIDIPCGGNAAERAEALRYRAMHLSVTVRTLLDAPGGTASQLGWALAYLRRQLANHPVEEPARG